MTIPAYDLIYNSFHLSFFCAVGRLGFYIIFHRDGGHFIVGVKFREAHA